VLFKALSDKNNNWFVLLSFSLKREKKYFQAKHDMFVCIMRNLYKVKLNIFF